MFTITPNDGAKIPCTLLKDSVAFNIPFNSTVKAAILNRDHTKLLTPFVTLIYTVSGSDWTVSEIVAVFTEEDLAGITTDIELVLEIQVTDDDTLTWYYKGEAMIGHII